MKRIALTNSYFKKKKQHTEVEHKDESTRKRFH